ncbi:MAG: hypothetical protein GY795_27770, partial [Desulfobacterales bacterium]|nr:hypothetical protein [Desulfobacterales bacterium]
MVLKHPFTAIVAGPTKAGKSVWVRNLIFELNNMVEPIPEDIFYCYTEWQPMYQELINHGVQMIEGLPDMADLKSNTKPKFLILNDLMQEMKADKKLVHLFTRGSHHWNMSVLHIVQNLFFDGLRTSRVNAQYLVLMKNPSDQLQASTLSKQLFPGKTKYFMEAYRDACSDSFGYLFIDLSQDTPEHMRLQTNVFPGQLNVVYVPKI